MQRLETQLAHFRFNTIAQHGPFNITWYVIETGDDSDEYGRCFNHIELKQFQQFVSSLPLNFPGLKNYFKCEEEEGPYCGGLAGLVPRQKLPFPSNVILRQQPNPNYQGNIYSCMDIILLNQNGTDNHTYNLEFDVIGRIDIIG